MFSITDIYDRKNPNAKIGLGVATKDDLVSAILSANQADKHNLGKVVLYSNFKITEYPHCVCEEDIENKLVSDLANSVIDAAIRGSLEQLRRLNIS